MKFKKKKNIPSQILTAPDLPVLVTVSYDKPHSLCYKELGPFLKSSLQQCLNVVLMLGTKGRKVNSK